MLVVHYLLNLRQDSIAFKSMGLRVTQLLTGGCRQLIKILKTREFSSRKGEMNKE